MGSTNRMIIYFDYFTDDNYINGKVECDEQWTIREFLDAAEKELFFRHGLEINLKNIHCVYLRFKKIEETEKLQDYSDDLEKNILFFTTEKPFESSFKLINLDDYENFQLMERLTDFFGILQLNGTLHNEEANCIVATDKKTKKEVFLKAFDSNPQNLRYIYSKMRGYSAISTLNHSGLVKILGFRYPLNEEERKQAKIHTILVGNPKKVIDLTGFIFAFEFVKYRSLKQHNLRYLNSKGFRNEIINPTIRCKIIYGIASMMKCMHNESIIHRNLDIDNVLIDEKHEPKFSGFKLAKIVENGINMTMYVGSPVHGT